MSLSVLTWRYSWVVETCYRKHYRKYRCGAVFYFITSYFGVYHFWTNAWVTQELFQEWHEWGMERVRTVGLLLLPWNRPSWWKDTVTIVFAFCNPRIHNEVTNSGEKWEGGEETRTTVVLPLLGVTYDEEKQQYAVYTVATKTQTGTGT